MSGRRKNDDPQPLLDTNSVPLHPPKSIRSPELQEGTPRAKTPDPIRLKDNELKALAQSGELLNIDKAFDLFGAGSLHFRRVVLVYSLLFLLVDCAWQLVIEMDRKINEANERTLSALCSAFCGCAHLHEKGIPTLLNSIGDATEWGYYYLAGNCVACIVFILTDSTGRKKPLLISILLTATEFVVAIWMKDEKLPMTIFILLFGVSSTLTYVCLLVCALESLPYKLRLPFAIFFFAARRVSHGIISALALYSHDHKISLGVCIIFLLLAAILTYLFIDETAAYLLLQEKMYELEMLFDKIRSDSDLVPDRSSQQITDELGFREDDFEMATWNYFKRVFTSKAIFYIANVTLLVSVVVACTPLVVKRFHLMGIDSTFTSFAISLAAIPLVTPLVLLSSHNRFEWLTSIELGAGFSMLALWCFTEGELDVCSDSTIYTGALWWMELCVLVVCEAFGIAVYIVGTVAMVEVVPTRARTFIVALLFTVSASTAAITSKIIMQNKVHRTTPELPIASALALLFAFVSIQSYSAPERMVDYLVDIIPKEKTVRRMKKAPKRKKTHMEINFPEVSSGVAEMANMVEENSSKTKDDNYEPSARTGGGGEE